VFAIGLFTFEIYQGHRKIHRDIILFVEFKKSTSGNVAIMFGLTVSLLALGVAVEHCTGAKIRVMKTP